MKDLSSLSAAEFSSFWNSFDDVLCDFDGVVFMEGKPIAGADKTLSKLKRCDKRVKFVTNNSTGGEEDIYRNLINIDDSFGKDDIALPTQAIVRYLKKIEFAKEVYVLGTKAAKKYFADAGFVVSKDAPYEIEERFHSVLANMQDNKDVGAVIFDYHYNLRYIEFVRVFAYLQRPEVLFITGATDKILPVAIGNNTIGQGFFQDVLKEVCRKEVLAFGKPSRNFQDYIEEKFRIKDPARTLFLGDMLEQDMGFAADCGYKKLLTLTGAATLEAVKAHSDFRVVPDFYIDSFGSLSELIEKYLNI